MALRERFAGLDRSTIAPPSRIVGRKARTLSITLVRLTAMDLFQASSVSSGYLVEQMTGKKYIAARKACVGVSRESIGISRPATLGKSLIHLKSFQS